LLGSRLAGTAEITTAPKPVLKLTTSLVSQKFCVGDAEVSMLHMNLRLRYSNAGERPIILDKGSNVAPTFLVSGSVADALAGKRELIQSADIVTSEEPRFTKNQLLDESFVVLAKGSFFETNCEVVVGFAVDDQNPPNGTIKKGDHVLQIQVITWWESLALAEELSTKWKRRGYLWHEVVQSEPMPFKIDQRVQVEDCR
jgi:hypothetical protein